MGDKIYYSTPEDQLKKLISQNLTIYDQDHALAGLRLFGYSNLIKSYRDPYILKSDDTIMYRDGVSFEQISSLYFFDKALRNTVMASMQDLEEHIKEIAANVIAQSFGVDPSSYLQYRNYQNKRKRKERFSLNGILHTMNEALTTDKEPIHHYMEKYGSVPPELELPVLLAAWLSFSMSEIRGLTKSKSISGDHIRIAEVVVVVGGKDHRKEIAKNKYRNRTHRIPPYIKSLIDKVPGDRLVTLTEAQIYHRWIKFQDEHRFKHMTFHDLRHLNASVMAALRIPDKYAQERGGWKSDKIMKKVYTQTFSEVRVAVDDKIDGYFDNIANPIMEKMPWEKYRAWLTLFGKEDNKKSQKEFMKFIEEQKIAT